MGKERLANLAMLHIHYKQKTDVDRVVNTFLGDGVSGLYCLIPSERVTSLMDGTSSRSSRSDVAVIDKEENCSAK